MFYWSMIFSENRFHFSGSCSITGIINEHRTKAGCVWRFARLDEGARGRRRIAADRRRGRLEYRARHHRAAGARRRHRAGAVVQQYPRLRRQCPLPPGVHRRAVERAPHRHDAGAAARHACTRARQDRPHPAHRQRAAEPGQDRAGQGEHRQGRRHRSPRTAGAAMESRRRRPLHHDVWRRRHQGSGFRRDECRHLSRHGRRQEFDSDPDVARPAYRPSRHRLAAEGPQGNADRGRDRLGRLRSALSPARRCPRGCANTT